MSIAGILAVMLLVELWSLPDSEEIMALRDARPQQTAFMKLRAEEAAKKGMKFRLRQQWVPLSRISRELVHAVVVAEDGTFFEHDGIDWYEVKESFKRNWQSLSFARGASTITQQLAKNLYLSSSKNPLRKIKEAIIAQRMESVLSKNRILEIYLNVIETGNGLFGVEEASRHYFGKPSAELSRDEAAVMAAVIPFPRKHTPVDQTKTVRRRANRILRQMSARGW